MNTFIFDLETTGLLKPAIAKHKHQPRVIEIYSCTLFRFSKEAEVKEIDYFHSLVDPERRIPREVIKTTGITNKDVKDSPLFEEIADEILKRILKCDRVVAHNVMFDKEVLDHEFYRLDKKFTWPELICTVEHTEHIFGKRPKLSDLYSYCTGRNPPKNIHRAKADVEMLKACYIYLCKKGIII